MTTSISPIPTLLRLRVLALRPRLILTEVQLVDDALLYQRIDGRDHIPTEVRAVRRSAADWANLRDVLDAAGVWSWPRRWSQRVHRYTGDFAVAVEWNGRAARSAGPIGVTTEVGAALDEVLRLVGNAPRRASKAVATLSEPNRHDPTHRTSSGTREIPSRRPSG